MGKGTWLKQLVNKTKVKAAESPRYVVHIIHDIIYALNYLYFFGAKEVMDLNRLKEARNKEL